MEEIERIDITTPGQNLLWIPFAERIEPQMTTHGEYPHGYPTGAIVHFTAGHQDQSGP